MQEFITRLSESLGVSNKPINFILTIIFVLVALYLVIRIVFSIIKRIGIRTESIILNEVYKKFYRPSLIISLLTGTIIVLYAFTTSIIYKDSIKHLLTLIIITGVTWLIIKVVQVGRIIIMKQYDISEKDNLKARKVFTQFRILERIIVFIIIIIAVSISLMTFEGIRRIGVSLFASAGVAGIILGFAAQKVIGSVLAGFQIAITQPIRIDDVVVIENEWGRIEEITLTYVVVRIWDKRRLILPTTYIIEKPFQNWTRVSSDILGTVYIYTDYTVPVNEIRNELTRILKEDKNWDGEVNVLQVTNSTEKTVELRALMSAVDSPTAWDLRVSVREKLIEFLQKNYPESLPHSRIKIEKIED